MKITFDARYIHTTENGVLPDGGIGRYSYQLLRHLLKLDPSLQLRLIVRAGNKRPIFDHARGNICEVRFRGGPNSLATLFRLGRVIDAHRSDVFHSPFNMMPRQILCPSVVTIHDIMWLQNPSLCTHFLPEKIVVGSLYRIGIRTALRTARRIITISRASKQTISEYDPTAANRIAVIYHGREPFFKKIPPENHQRQKRIHRLIPANTPFVLSVGQGSPYKNQPRAVEAFLRAFAHEPAMKFVLVRRFARFDGQWMRLMRRQKPRGRLILLDRVTDAELRVLYNRARLFLFPSLQEGFGMPLLEAMACSVPVLTSNTGALLEISGGAALAVNPADTEAIASGLVEIHRNPKLRQRLIAAGKARVMHFCWQKTAEKTLAVYRDAVRAKAG